MNLKTYILVFIILLASGNYFTGSTGRLPRVAVKAYVDLGKSGNLTEKSWMEDPMVDYTIDLKATEYSRLIFSQPVIHITDSSEPGLIQISKLDLLLLDRPPPVQV